MSIQHHNAEEQAARKRLFDEIFGTAKPAFPHGKVGADDQGETAFAVAADPSNGIVRIQFTKPMNWIGLDKASAIRFSDLLREKANDL